MAAITFPAFRCPRCDAFLPRLTNAHATPFPRLRPRSWPAGTTAADLTNAMQIMGTKGYKAMFLTDKVL